MDCIYHGCMTKNADGANRIIGPGERCFVPTSRPFWKHLEDIDISGVKTRNQYKRQPTVSIRAFDTYFRNKNKKVLRDENSTLFRGFFYETIRSILRHLANATVIILTTANNGNNLSDGTNERKNLQRK